MKVERLELATVDECLDTLEAAFQSDMWKQLPEWDRRHLVHRLYIILRDIGEGSYVAMTRHALILVPLLLSSSPSYSQSKNVSYYCAVDLIGDRWYSAKDQNFIMKMTFIGQHNSTTQFDDYYVSITPSGSNVPIDCRGRNRSKIVSAEYDIIRCSATNIYYVFNQRRNRFWRLLLDWNSSGTCTKIGE